MKITSVTNQQLFDLNAVQVIPYMSVSFLIEGKLELQKRDYFFCRLTNPVLDVLVGSHLLTQASPSTSI